MSKKTKKVLEVMAWIAGTIAVIVAAYGLYRTLSC